MSRSEAFQLPQARAEDVEGLPSRVKAEGDTVAATRVRADAFLAETAAFVAAHDDASKRNVAKVLDGLLGKR